MIEKLLQFLVGEIDAKLFKTVELLENIIWRESGTKKNK
jgi:hypothetical protein